MDKQKRSKDLLIAKTVDMKMKQQELGKVFIDEVDYIQTIYILRGTRLYSIDINSKQLKELEFSKKHTVLYVNSNKTNQYLIILFKNGRIFGYSKTKHIIYFQGLKSIPSKDTISSYHIYSNAQLTKLAIVNDSSVVFWFKTHQRTKELNVNIKEYQGEVTSIDLAQERRNLIKEGNNYNESFIVLFNDGNSNSNYGSMIKAYYFVLEEIRELKSIKAYMVEYLLRFDIDNHFNAIDLNKEDSHYEYKKYFDTKYIYNYLITGIEENEFQSQAQSKPYGNSSLNKNIIMRDSLSGKMIVIGLNLIKQNNAIVILFMPELYKFTSVRLGNLFSSRKDKVYIEDIGIICKDLFFIIQFKNGLFTFLNLNLQVVNFYEGSHYIAPSRGLETLYILNYFENNKLDNDEKVSVIYSRTISNFFLFYSSQYLILFQCHYKNFETRMFAPCSFLFDDFVLELKFSQAYMQLSDSDHNTLLDNIHGFIFNHFNSIFKGEVEMAYGQNESLTNAIKFIINFLRIFRSLNWMKEVNQTLISYLICISNDFFFYLLSLKELWLSLLFVRLVEKYLLKPLKLRHSHNKINDTQVLKNQRSFSLLNPYYSISNPKLKCYNTIVNRLLLSKHRVLLVFFALIEFRNNQALNINVLYFSLAKEAMRKLMKHKLLDDALSILRVLIRNWRFLQGENEKAGSEEFVLNDLTLNYRTESLAAFMHKKTDRADIKLNFFKCFYTFEELHNFTELNEIYCRGDDEALINEYGYANNSGVIQKWILFFVNFFYSDMFADVKGYIDNHVKQTIDNDIRKQTENISPEEYDLSKIVYFNVYFSFMLLSLFLENLMEILSISQCENLIENLNKKFVLFISPVDVPYLIFEFSYIENDSERLIDQSEIIRNLHKYIVGYFKEYNMTLQEGLEYIEFIISKGFKHIISDCDLVVLSHIGSNSVSRIQIYLYSSVVFYLMSMVKIIGISLLPLKQKMLNGVIESLNDLYKKGVYQLILLIFNGYIKYYLSKECYKTIGSKDDNCFRSVLVYVNSIYCKLLTEEDDRVRGIISEYINMTPLILQVHLIERTLFYECKSLRRILKSEVLDSNANADLMEEFNQCTHQVSFYNWMINRCKSIQSTIDNIYSCLLLHNSEQKENTIRFSIRTSNVSEIRKLIIRKENKTTAALNIDDLINKIIIENLSFNSTYDQPSINFIESMKESFIKILYYLHIFYAKFVLRNMEANSIKEFSLPQYLKQLSYVMIFEKDTIKCNDYFNYSIDYLKSISSSSNTITNDKDKETLFDICLNMHYTMIFNTELRTLNDKCTIIIKKALKGIGSSFLIRYDQFLIKELSVLILLYDRKDTPHVNSKIKKMLILYTNDTFISITQQLIDSIITDSISNIQSKVIKANKITTEKFINYHKAFCALTGMPSESRVVFRESFELTQSDELLQYIIQNNNKSKDKSYYYYAKVYEEILLEETSKEPSGIDMKSSIKIKENSIQYNDDNDIIREETCLNRKIIISKANNDKDTSNNTTMPIRHLKPIEILIKSIQKHYFNKLLLGFFYQFKSQMAKIELNELTFLNIKPKEASFDSITIKEKYLTTNEIEQIQKDDLFTIKNYDIISMPKMKLGRSNNSKLLKELMKQTKATKLSDAIRIKVAELNDKVNQYEEMTKTLGKQFVSDITK